MPKVYTPRAARMLINRDPPKRQESWAVGEPSGEEGVEIGMKAGPFYNKFDALEEIGDEGDVIVHFLEDGTDELEYRWNEDMVAWVKVTE